MDRENTLVNTLALESEKIDGFKALPKLRYSSEIHEVSAWDNAMNKTLFEHLEENLRKKNESINLSRKESLSPMFELKFAPKFSKRLKGSPTPLAYKIATIALIESRDAEKPKKIRKNSDRLRLLNSNKQMSSLYFPNNRRVARRPEGKRNSVPEISNILSLLKPEIRNPVKAMIIPQLKSRTELYRSCSKRKSRKKDLAVFESFSPELKKINLKMFK